MAYISKTIALAVQDMKTRDVQKIWVVALALSLAVIFALWQGLVIVSETVISEWSWVIWLSDKIGFLGWFSPLLLGAVFLLFPSIMMGVLFLFADAVIDVIEKRHYNHTPKQAKSVLGGITETVHFSLKMMGYNIVFLPLYLILIFIPPLSFALYLLINGWLLAKEYFHTLGSRYHDRATLNAHWGQARMPMIMYCMALSAVLVVPFLNLFIPIIGLIGMVHLWHNHPKIQSISS